MKIEIKKKIFFYSVLISTPLFLVGILEFSLRLFSYGDNLSLFIPASNPDYLTINQNVGKRYFTKVEETTPLNDFFLKEKPVNGYRLFILGESSVQGFPYDANLAFSRILQRRLKDVFPNHKIEVVNLGMTAINSYTLLDFTDELLKQKPDAVLIYTGHNEYYGALGVASMENGEIAVWLKKLHLYFIHFRTYQLLRNVIGGFFKLIHPPNQNEAKETLMQQMVGKNIIPYNSEMYNEGLSQFRDNMSRLFTKLKKAKVAVIISDLVSNIKDLPPFYSLKYEDNPPADSIYSMAKRFEADSLFGIAKENYVRAKDLDAIRFRAPESINKIISDLADSFNLYHISLKSLFEKNSPGGLIGNNLMAEHLHANIDGHFLMAEGFFNGLREYKMIGNEWDSLNIKPWSYYKANWGYTELDSMIAEIRIKHLKAGWPFKPDTTVNNFKFTYKPNGIVDSLAFMTVKYSDASIENAHKNLAKFYESKGELKKASDEYLSLAYMYPMTASYFYSAANLSFKAKNYGNCINILKESPNPDTSAFAQFILSNSYYMQGKYDEALSSVNKLQKLPQNESNNLLSEKLKYKILIASGNNYEAEKILASIKKSEPGFSGSGRNKPLIILIPEKIKPYIEKAERLRRNGQLSEALAILTEANSIQETAYSNLLIGKILLRQNNPNSSIYLEKASKEIKDDPSLSYNLCLLYLMKKDFPNAKVAMNDFIRIKGKDDPQSEQLQILYEKQSGRKPLSSEK